MEIRKENVLAAYEIARKAGADTVMKVLEQLFGNKPGNITDRIKTFDDACAELGKDHPLVEAYKQCNVPNVDAYLKLRIICAALNEGWEPKFTVGETRYYPLFTLLKEDVGEGIAINGSDYKYLVSISDECEDSSTNPVAGPCLKSEELAIYCGEQFIDIWAKYLLIP